jgi:hypothetical protein
MEPGCAGADGAGAPSDASVALLGPPDPGSKLDDWKLDWDRPPFSDPL